MKALFVYTAKIFTVGDCHFSNNLPSSIWRDRYRRLFDEVTVYARQIDVNECREASSDYDRVYFHLTHLGVDKKELILKKNAIYKEIDELVRESDFVIARMGFFGVLAAKSARKNQKPYVCECAGSSWDDLWNYSLSGKFAALWLQPQVKYEFHKAKYAVYVTNQYLQNEYPCCGKTVGISNVVLAHHDNDVISKRESNIKTKQIGEPFILGTAAAVDVPYKGQRYVIRALKILSDKGYNVIYRLAGNGNTDILKKEARKWGVEDKVEFIGALPLNLMAQYYDDIDIYIQPSLQEGLPRAMIEAMGRGVPAIGFKTAGIPELIDPEWVCPQRSVNGLILRIEMLMNDQSRYIRVAQRNFLKSFEYEKDVLEERWYNFYKKAIEESRNYID